MKRRRFLIMTAGGIAAAGAGAGTGIWLFCSDRNDPRDAQRHLTALAGSMIGVAAVGRAWRDSNGEADAQQSLLHSLRFDGGEIVAYDEFVRRLAERVEGDLDQGRIFRHEGWWLAETEARLAALHVAMLGPDSSEGESPEFDRAPEGRIVRLKRFQPRSMHQGETLTRPGMPDRVIWFATAAPPPPRLVVMIAGRRMTTRVTDNGFSITVPKGLVGHFNTHPGEHEMWLYDPVTNRRQLLGEFTVHAGEPDKAGFCPVERWGPQETAAGKTFNEQSDGTSAIWIRISCFPASTVAVFDGVELPTTLRRDDGVITTNIPDPTLFAAPGAYRLELLDRESGDTQLVGTFNVTPAE